MKIKISQKLDNIAFLIDELKRSSSEVGAIAVFIGAVRGTREDEKVLKLEYEAHEALAKKTIEKIVKDIKNKYGIISSIVEHRLGIAKVGEDVMCVMVASKHREESFRALSELVDRIKHEVPIWKKEVTEKGAHWIENP